MSDNRLILLGTKGGPRIGKGTAWPTSNLLVVEGKPYLIDAGLGVTRQVCNAGFLPYDIDRIFLTHNHSDHNLELGGFIQTGWTSGPMSEMKVYGAPGVANLMEHFLLSQSFDINIRVKDEGATDLREIVTWEEISEGAVYEDERVKVSCSPRDPPACAPLLRLQVRDRRRDGGFRRGHHVLPATGRLCQGRHHSGARSHVRPRRKENLRIHEAGEADAVGSLRSLPHRL